ncbi:hypothetical protein, partial [Bacteroides faecis]|uniref:hypothetical protein n=1 Tax=Bacteroides faecis TaxID=674529 RepID=UPI0014871C3A
MEEKKKQAVESGSLYMTLDAFYRPVYLSMRGQGEEGFSRYISNNVRSHTTEVVSKRWHNLFLCTKPRLSQARALLLPKVFVSLGIKFFVMAKLHFRPYLPNQTVLFPGRIDENIAANDPVRIVNTVVD